MYKNLIFAIEHSIAHLSIHRPERRNAVSRQTIEELDQAVAQLEHQTDLKAVILSGTGEDAFISGGDLKELKAFRTHEEALGMHRSMAQVLRRLELLDCPVIVAINGMAVGGGCEVALVGDVRLMATEASLVFRQATLGLTCGWGGLTRLQRLVGRSRAFQILLVRQQLTAEQALALGVVDEVMPRAALMDRAQALAADFSALPPLALKAIKRGMVRAEEMPFERSLDYEAELFARTWASEDHWEALEAFFARRPPTFSGR